MKLSSIRQLDRLILGWSGLASKGEASSVVAWLGRETGAVCSLTNHRVVS